MLLTNKYLRILISSVLLMIAVSSCVPGDPIPDNLVTRNIYPGTNITYDIGAPTYQYRNAYFNNIYLNGGIPILNVYVPYIGATANVTLGSFDLSTSTLRLPMIATAPSVGVGELALHTMNSHGIDGLQAADDTGFMYELSQDTYFTGRNTTGIQINKGQVVYATGATGNVPNLALAKSDNITTISRAVGIAAENIAINGFGRCFISGIIENINTSAFAVGDTLYISETVAGEFTNIRPTNPNYAKEIGTVTSSGVGNGSILIRMSATFGNETGTNNPFTIGGSLNMTSNRIISLADPFLLQDAATKNYVDSAVSGNLTGIFVPYAGATGNIDLATREISNAGLNSITASGTWTSNGTWTIPAVTLGGTVSAGSNNIINMADPINPQDAATRNYVDTNSFSNPMNTLGDIIYGGIAGAANRLAGDVSGVRKFLIGQAVGGVAQIPVWDTIQAADVPVLNQDTTGTAAKATSINITDDITTNATMYPVWVTANTSTLPAKVSSSKLTFNPSTGKLSASELLATAATIDSISSHNIQVASNLASDWSNYVTVGSTSTPHGLTLSGSATMYALGATAVVESGSGVTTLIGITASTYRIASAGPETIPTSIQLRIGASSTNTNWTINTFKGIDVQAITHGDTNNYGIYLADNSAGIGAYSIYSAGGANYFAGTVQSVGGFSGNLTGDVSGTSLNVTGIVTEIHGGTNQSSYILGDVLYASGTDTLSKLAADTSDVRMFLRTQSIGGTGQAPMWDSVTKADVGLSAVENVALSTWTGSANLTTLGTIISGTWNGGVIGPAYGGTGVANNAASTLTISGNFASTFTMTNVTSVTFPTSGTLATLTDIGVFVPYTGATGNIDLATREISNAGLNAITASGIWTTNGTWTIPAVTLGGTMTLNGQTFSGDEHLSGAFYLDTNNTSVWGKTTGGSDLAIFLLDSSNTVRLFPNTGNIVRLVASAANAGATIQDSPTLKWTARYWNGSADTLWDYSVINDMTATTPASTVSHKINNVSVLDLINTNGVATGELYGHWGINTVASSVATLNINENYVDTTNARRWGIVDYASLAKTTASFTNTLNGLELRASVAAANTQDWTSVLGSRGFSADMQIVDGATGNITGMAGFVSKMSQLSTTGAILTNYYGAYLDNATATGQITNLYGVYIAAQTAGTTINYAIYANGGYTYLNGHVGIKTGVDALFGIKYSETITLTDNSVYTGIYSDLLASHTTASYTGLVKGGYFIGDIQTTNTQNWTRSIGGLVGSDSRTTVREGATGTITSAISAYIAATFGSTAAVTNWDGVRIANPTITGTPLVNAYGIRIDAITAGSTLNYAIYAAGGRNYFAGNTGIGTTGSTTSILSISETKTDTAAGSVQSIVGTLTVTPVANSASEFRSLYFQLVPNAASGITYGTIQGGYFENRIRCDGAIATSVGVVSNGWVVDSSSPATTQSTVAAVAFDAIVASRPSGTSNTTMIEADAFRVRQIGNAGLTATNVYEVNLINPTGTISNVVGVNIPNLTTGSVTNYSIYSGTAPSYFAGNIGIGQTTATALLHLKAGTATASTAPIKLTTGTLLTNPEAGAIEYLTPKLYYTDDGAIRQTLVPDAYADMYNDEAAVTDNITVAGTYYLIEGWTAGSYHLNTISTVSSNITVDSGGDGVYSVGFNVGVSVNGANRTLHVAVFVNGVEQIMVDMEEKTVAIGDLVSFGDMGILTLAAGDYVELRATSSGAGDVLTFNHASLMMNRIAR